MNKRVVVIGAGGHAKAISDVIKKSNDEIVGYLDDTLSKQNSIVYEDKRVLGIISEEYVNKYLDCYFIIAIGDNKARKRISKRFSYVKWYTAIDPSAVIGSNVSIGEGTAIMTGAIITYGVTIGKHCIINTCSSIDHESKIGDFIHVSCGSHLAGDVKVGSGTWICAGVTISNKISIAEDNIIGAGATVIRDINETGNTYVGVPVRRIIKDKEIL